MTRIGIVGDRDDRNETHRATTTALAHAGAEAVWVGTERIATQGPGTALAGLDGLLIAPGSPYHSMAGALAAITHARTADLPLLGTCGGFQHVVLEFARATLGIADAQHAEYDPYASTLFISELTCSLAGQVLTVRLRPGSRAAAAYGTARTSERYYCNFGLNPAHLGTLTSGDLQVTGTDADGEPRILELPALRFFVATLFVPQARSRPDAPHPLVVALVSAARDYACP